MKIVVTGAAGFVGFHVAEFLLQKGEEVIGIDNLNSYYDVSLKNDRLSLLKNYPNFAFFHGDIVDAGLVDETFSSGHDVIIHLAAQAGVRYSIENPRAYIDSNLVGFLNILESCRRHQPRHLLYASSSSVYGGNTKLLFSVKDSVDHPVSLYAATKKANELMAHTYSHLYGVPTTGLRFFTVYGPWGRPDMAYFKFVKAIFEGRPIDVYNNGDMFRDFTYIDDIVWSIGRLIDQAPQPSTNFDETLGAGASWAPYRVVNLGNRRKEKLLDMIAVLEQATNRKVEINFLPMQAGDVVATWADVGDLEQLVGEMPQTLMQDGLQRFVRWYRDYYQVS